MGRGVLGPRARLRLPLGEDEDGGLKRDCRISRKEMLGCRRNPCAGAKRATHATQTLCSQRLQGARGGGGGGGDYEGWTGSGGRGSGLGGGGGGRGCLQCVNHPVGLRFALYQLVASKYGETGAPGSEVHAHVQPDCSLLPVTSTNATRSAPARAGLAGTSHQMLSPRSNRCSHSMSLLVPSITSCTSSTCSNALPQFGWGRGWGLGLGMGLGMG